MVEQPLVKQCIPDQPVLHHLGKSRIELSVVQFLKCSHIHVDKLRHIERAHHVFVAVKIDACLSTDAAV